MGAVRMRVQTVDKNITVIHTTPVQQCLVKQKAVYLLEINESLNHFTFNTLSPAKIKVHNP